MRSSVILPLLGLALAGTITNPSLRIDPTWVRALSTYTVIFDTESSVDADYRIVLSFPGAIVLSASSSYACSVQVDISVPSNYTCESTESSLTVLGAFAEVSHNFSVNVLMTFQVNNPSSSAKTDPIGIAVTDSNGGPVDIELNSNNMRVSATPVQSQAASITPESFVIGAETTWLIEVTPTYPVLVGSNIVVAFPYWDEQLYQDPSSVDSSDFLHFFQTTASCEAVQNLSSALECQYSNENNELVITNAFDQVISDPFSLNVSGLKNPPTPEQVSGFAVSLTDSAGGEYESLSNLAVTADQPNVLTVSSVIPSDTDIIGEISSYEIRFSTSNYLYAGCKVRVEVPTEVAFDSTISAQALSRMEFSLSASVQADNSILLENGFASYIQITGTFYFSFDEMTNPSSSFPSGPFVLTTLTPTDRAIDTGSGGEVSASPGQLLQYESQEFVRPDNPVKGATTFYQFEFTTSHIIPTGGYITIQYPQEINIEQRNADIQCYSAIAGIAATATCEVTDNFTIRVYGAFPNALPGSSRVAFQIDRVTNPDTTAPTSTFKIYTHPSEGFDYFIDQVIDGVTVQPSPSLLTSASVVSSSDITGEVAVFTFSIETTSEISTDGYLLVKFPSEIQSSDDADAESSCTRITWPGTGDFSCEVSLDGDRNTVKVIGFSGGSFAPGPLEFSIGFFRNPNSTKKTRSFEIGSYDSDGNSIDVILTEVTITLTEPNQLAGASVVPESFTNGVLTRYTVSVQVTNITPASLLVNIESPGNVVFPVLPNCTAGLQVQAVSCANLDSATIEASITLNGELASQQEFTFIIDDVQNPRTTEPTDTFKVYTFTADGFAIDLKEDSVIVSTTTAALISEIAVTADSLISATTDYTFSFVPVNPYPIGTVLTVTIPSVLNTENVSCTSAIFPGLTCQVVDKTVTFSEFTSSIASPFFMDFTLRDIVNPDTQVAATAWVIESTVNQYLIDISNDQVPVFTCTSPCASCETTPSTCLSCLPDSSMPYFYASVCNETCLDGEVDLIATAEKECVPCDSNCAQCVETAEKCTACDILSGRPFLFGDTCNPICPDGYYGSGTACLDCVNPCNTCTSASECSSCEAITSQVDFGKPTYLLGQSCLIECDAGYLENSVTLQCDPCTNDCADCEGTTATCVACSASMRLLGTSCVDNCPTDNTYIDDGSSCQPCESPCLTCGPDTSTCLSCQDSALFTYKGTCVATCPVNSLLSGSICQPCEEPCDLCTGNTNICSSCLTGFFLKQTSCVSDCGDGYWNDGISCQECNAECNTCTVSVDVCASCPTGKFLLNGSCLTECPSLEYVPDPGQCTPCESPCVTCSGTPTNCKSCATGQLLYDGTCVAACPDGLSVESNGNCLKCDDSCATCAGAIDSCTSCNSPALLQDTDCVDACGGGYVEIDGECTPCNSVCFACQGTPSYCISCPSETYLHQNWCVATCPENYAPTNGKCEELTGASDCNTGCPDNLLANDTCEESCNVSACQFDNGKCVNGPVLCGDGEYESNDTCEDCPSPCDQCESATVCTTCENNADGTRKLLFEGNCYETCPSGSFKSSNLACGACNTRCSECVGDADTCTACKDPYLIYNNQCIVSCPASITIQVNSSCIDCNSNCLTCENAIDECATCSSSLVLQGTRCQEQCNSGYTTTSATPNTCKICSSECLECSGETSSCTECTPDKFLYSNQCLDVCPTGTYSTGNACTDCQSGCLACSGFNNCSACNPGYSFYQGICEADCPAGYEDVDGQCQQIVIVNCANGCTQTLLDNEDCNEACNNAECGLDNGRCSDEKLCNAGDYHDGNSCQPCQAPCKTCSSLAVCTSCLDETIDGNVVTLLLHNGDCVYPCPSNTLVGPLSCTDCNENCKACASTVDTCVECPDDQYLYLGTCVDACPSGISLKNDDLMICRACFSDCATCEDTVDNCTSCPDGKVLQGTDCQSTCDQGFTTTTDFPTTCKECTGDCVNCAGEAGICTECIDPLFLFDGVCYESCPEQISIVSGTSCLPCESPCAECLNSVDICTVCDANYYLHINRCLSVCPEGFEPNVGTCEPLCSEGCTQDLLNNDVCDTPCNTSACTLDKGQCPVDTDCPAGKYRDAGVCVNCIYPCNSCESAAYCTSCQISTTTSLQLYSYNGQCYDSCPISSYQQGIICLDCDSDCLACENTSDNCTGCLPDEKLYQGSCLPSCPLGTTIEENGVCKDCNNTCAECSGTTTTCTKCPTGSFLSGSTCFAECPTGFTTTPASGNDCVACQSPCASCLGATNSCTSCSGDILHDFSCIDECPEGYTETLIDPGICTKCSSACLACSTSITNCTSCPTGYKLTQSATCQLDIGCPEGTTLDSSGNCVTCISPCVTCQDSQTNCLSCVSGMALDGGVCQPCSSPCITCDGGLSVCTSCVEGYFLSGSQCVECTANCRTCEGNSYTCTACGSGFRLTGDSCFACNGNCATCAEDFTTCTSCPEDQFLIDSQCVSCDSSCKACENSPSNCTECNPGTYLVGSDCLLCDSSCAECEDSPTTCTACDTGKSLILGVCGTCKGTCATCVEDFDTCASCPEGMDLVNGECGNCNENCGTCQNDFATCLSCKDGMFLIGTVCYGCDSNCLECAGLPDYCTSCESPQILVDNSCVPCDSSCATCFGTPENCTSCGPGLSLILGQCLQCATGCVTCTTSVSDCDQCYDGWYLSGTSCIQCDSSCKTCDSNPFNCLTCPSGTEKAGNACVVTCEDGETVIGSTCQACTGDCATCTGSTDACLSCLSKPILYNQSCYDDCPEGTYLKDGSCENCSSLCRTCESSAINCKSCNSGYELVGTTCYKECEDGEFYNLSTCQPCHSICKTCEGSSTNCLTCEDPLGVPSDNCRVPCEKGTIRTESSGEICEDCTPPCTACTGSTSYCTECLYSSQVLFDGLCLNSCPTNTTVQLGSSCVSCTSECLTCEGISSNCTSCASDLKLLSNGCVEDCPSNFYELGSVCEECSDLNNCPPVPLNTTSTEETFDSGSVPFPFTGFVVVTGGLMAASKLAAAGIGFVPSAISIWGFAAPFSWTFLVFYVPITEDESAGRRLFLVEGSDGDIIISICILLIIIAIITHLLCNLWFGLFYFKKLLKSDKRLAFWKLRFPISHGVISGLSVGVSFHCIRLLYCGLCNQSVFKAEFDDRRKLIKSLIQIGYVSILCTIVPMVSAQIMLLVYYSTSNWMWMFSLDSLILTLLLLLLLIIDNIQNEKDLVYLKIQKRNNKDLNDLIPPENSMDNLISSFPFFDFRCMIPAGIDWYKSKDKGHSTSKPPSRSTSPRPKLVEIRRKMSFPLENNIEIELDSDLQRNQVFVPDEPICEELLKGSISEDQTFLEDPNKGELTISAFENKKSVIRPTVQAYRPLDMSLPLGKYTEIIAMTEEQSEGESMLQELSPPVLEEHKNFDYLGMIDREDELDLDKAIVDRDDAEVLTVPHLKTGELVKIRKEFKEARVVNQNNKIIESIPPIEIRSFHAKSAVVEDSDPHFATIKAHSGEYVRVKRHFRGAHIIEFKPRIRHQHGFLIGMTVSDENDFAFENAYPDPEDPEIVVVLHLPTREEVKVRKRFQNAKIVNEFGEVLATQLGVNRNDFDLSRTIVSRTDVHFATLRYKKTQKSIRVIRSFVGGKIINIEKRQDSSAESYIKESQTNEINNQKGIPAKKEAKHDNYYKENSKKNSSFDRPHKNEDIMGKFEEDYYAQTFKSSFERPKHENYPVSYNQHMNEDEDYQSRRRNKESAYRNNTGKKKLEGDFNVQGWVGSVDPYPVEKGKDKSRLSKLAQIITSYDDDVMKLTQEEKKFRGNATSELKEYSYFSVLPNESYSSVTPHSNNRHKSMRTSTAGEDRGRYHSKNQRAGRKNSHLFEPELEEEELRPQVGTFYHAGDKIIKGRRGHSTKHN